jgi:TolA-binding protein
MTGSERQCPEDLVVRAQRSELSELERHALDAHLAQCAPCRVASTLATLFDAIPETQPGDTQLIARVRDKTTQAHRHWRRGSLQAAAVVAVVVLGGSVAVAAWITHQRTETRMGDKPTSDPNASRTPARSQGMSKPAAKVEVPAAREAPAATGDEPKQPPETERKRRQAVPAAEVPPAIKVAPTVAETTPASLFTQANAVRRAGEMRKAIELYQALRRRFPDSLQAHLSAISEGDLLLSEGDPAQAIVAYGAYLRAAPQGPLTEEALFGKARGLAMLGQSKDERQTWQELARRFPRSAYYPAASRRLKELAP